jgi:hypothetical protein
MIFKFSFIALSCPAIIVSHHPGGSATSNHAFNALGISFNISSIAASNDFINAFIFFNISPTPHGNKDDNYRENQ